MKIEELAELQKEGFAGIHQRLDALNGRTRQTEVGVAELKLQAANADADRRLRALEITSAVSNSTLRNTGIKWGAIASTTLTLILYVVSWLVGIPAPPAK